MLDTDCTAHGGEKKRGAGGPRPGDPNSDPNVANYGRLSDKLKEADVRAAGRQGEDSGSLIARKVLSCCIVPP